MGGANGTRASWQGDKGLDVRGCWLQSTLSHPLSLIAVLRFKVCLCIIISFEDSFRSFVQYSCVEKEDDACSVVLYEWYPSGAGLGCVTATSTEDEHSIVSIRLLTCNTHESRTRGRATMSDKRLGLPQSHLIHHIG